MNTFVFARVLHVLGVVLWIGGVAMVTTVLLPAIRQRAQPGENPVAAFEAIEGRFARQARWTTALVGATGFYMVHRMDAWAQFLSPAYWWLWAMVFVWVVFTLMLFVLEPLFLDKFMHARSKVDPDGTMVLLQRLHYGLLGISLITIVGAMAGAHGWFLF